MELHLTPEKEALIHQFAARKGKDTSQVVEEASDRMLEYDARFNWAAEKGREASRRSLQSRFGNRRDRVAEVSAEDFGESCF